MVPAEGCAASDGQGAGGMLMVRVLHKEIELWQMRGMFERTEADQLYAERVLPERGERET